MNWDCSRTPHHGGSAPATPGFNAVAPEWLVTYGAADAAPAVPAAESTLGSHPCVALSSAQVLPEWINRNLAGNAFSANGDYSLNFVSHSRGSLQKRGFTRTSCCERAQNQAESLVGNARAMIKFTAWPFAAPCWISSNRHPCH